MPLPTFKPNQYGIDGHLFRINYDVPQSVTDTLYALLEKDNPKYEDIPAECLEYEIEDKDKDLRQKAVYYQTEEEEIEIARKQKEFDKQA